MILTSLTIHLLHPCRSQGKLLYCHPPPGVDEESFSPHLFVFGAATDAPELDPMTQANTIALYSTAGQTVCVRLCVCMCVCAVGIRARSLGIST